MLFGRFLIIEGGWLLCLRIHVKLLFGFLDGLLLCLESLELFYWLQW